MKQEDVAVGQVYLSYIGDELARVVVVQRRVGVAFNGKRKPIDTFDVKREGTMKVLPKPRTAAALHEVKTDKEGKKESFFHRWLTRKDQLSLHFSKDI